jgi:hypothetical protein
MAPRRLTKSKFQLAMECPTKLYYCDKPEYSNLKSEDSFLQALAESGFQVAELAKAYYTEGRDLRLLNDEQAIIETNKLLKQEKVIIFEAAVLYNNLFIRADILIKEDDHLTLIEVKSKSIGLEDKLPLFTSRKPIVIRSNWEPYVFDVAFQKHVLSNAFPTYYISSYLMLVDKNSASPSDGLNQKFRISKDENGRVKIITSVHLTQQDLSQQILKKINVADEVSFIFSEMKFRGTMSFSEYVNFLSEHYAEDIKIPPILGTICKKCEFRIDPKSIDPSLKSGFNECWSEVCSLKEDEVTILEVWDFRKADSLIRDGIYKIKQLTQEDIDPKPDGKPGMSPSQRKWEQVQKTINNDDTEKLEINDLRSEMNSWTYPLHFIDFETAMPAIPFNKGERPFLGLAFQFSHHILHEDGLVEHSSQYFNDKVGINPNLDFIRALKSSLKNSTGTIFRYAPHENTYLNMIHTQLQKQDSIPDKEGLISFIESISQPTEANQGKWKVGPRNMVDLWELVKRYYYDPQMKGSNSIKKVFPAILNRSAFLKDKYGKPIYWTDAGIKSLNFKDWQWIKEEGNKFVDPYELLPSLFKGIDLSEEKIDFLFHDDKLKEGGSASIAYARMQFSEMTELERSELKRALLQYCELDTLAMVMIVEAWRDTVFGAVGIEPVMFI